MCLAGDLPDQAHGLGRLEGYPTQRRKAILVPGYFLGRVMDPRDALTGEYFLFGDDHVAAPPAFQEEHISEWHVEAKEYEGAPHPEMWSCRERNNLNRYFRLPREFNKVLQLTGHGVADSASQNCLIKDVMLSWCPGE